MYPRPNIYRGNTPGYSDYQTAANKRRPSFCAVFVIVDDVRPDDVFGKGKDWNQTLCKMEAGRRALKNPMTTEEVLGLLDKEPWTKVESS